jgi:hypothetical protein
MANPEIQVLTKDIWNEVLTNATYYGRVFILPQDNEPTRYLVTLREVGTGAPAPTYEGGVPIRGWTAPTSTTAVNLYIKPVDYDGRVEVYA